jgi:plastocyanin
MSMRSKLVVATALVALLGAACGGDDSNGDTEGATGGGGGEAVTLTASAGGSIELVNEDEAEHNLTIEDAGVDEDVEGGETITVDLAGVEAGSYDFVCEYHPDTMKGTLEVE